MVRLEGFEPPTVRVEAEYSNPLSYSRIYLFIPKRSFLSYPLNERQNMVRETGLEPVCLAAGDFKSPEYTYFSTLALFGLGGRARICHSWSQTTCVAINTSPSIDWSNERDLNPRFSGFAIPCIGPLCHRCVKLAHISTSVLLI
jgi:hypothetical protein